MQTLKDFATFCGPLQGSAQLISRDETFLARVWARFLLFRGRSWQRGVPGSSPLWSALAEESQFLSTTPVRKVQFRSSSSKTAALRYRSRAQHTKKLAPHYQR